MSGQDARLREGLGDRLPVLSVTELVIIEMLRRLIRHIPSCDVPVLVRLALPAELVIREVRELADRVVRCPKRRNRVIRVLNNVELLPHEKVRGQGRKRLPETWQKF